MIYVMNTSSRLARPSESIRVGVQVSPEYGPGRRTLEGIMRYNDERGQWSFVWDRTFHADFHRRHPLDAMIAEVRSPDRIGEMRRLKMPVVAVTGVAALGKLPLVSTDHELMGTIAAEHFLELGLEHVAGLVNPSNPSELVAGESFQRAARDLDFASCGYLQVDLLRLAGAKRTQVLQKWLQELPRPVGVFAAFDVQAIEVTSTCLRSGIRVPEDVTVLGAGNDELLCRLSDPPLSSIETEPFELGYQAAELLDRILQGKSSGLEVVRVAPSGVERRQSTDILAVRDSEVARALLVIRDHACDGLTAAEAARRVNVSRSRLEFLFKRVIGRSVHQEIVRIRLHTARCLLRDTTLSMPEITVRCGVSYPSQLSHLFRKHFGVSPSHYRQRKHPESQ